MFNYLNGAVQKRCIKSLGTICETEEKSQEKFELASQRSVVKYGAVGVLIAIALIATVVLGPPLLTANAGIVDIKVTDAPVLDLSSLNITVDQVTVRVKDAEEATNDTEEWINVTIAGGNVTFDLVKLRNITKDLALGQIPVGNYTKIRMHVLSAVGKIDGGDVISVRIPSSKIDVLVPRGFEVKSGQTTSIILDIQFDTIKIAANPAHNVSPVVKATIIPPV